MAYDQCIREVEKTGLHQIRCKLERHCQHFRKKLTEKSRATLVFSSSGGMGPSTKAVYKKLASMVATKHKQSYSQTISWLQCRLSFFLLRSSIMCLRGSCSSAGNPQLTEAAIDRAICGSELDMNLATTTYKISSFFIPLHCASLFYFYFPVEC